MDWIEQADADNVPLLALELMVRPDIAEITLGLEMFTSGEKLAWAKNTMYITETMFTQ